MATKLNYKQVAFQAAIYAFAFGMVNKLMAPKKRIGLDMKTLAFLPLEHQAIFADHVTVENAGSSIWLVEQMANQDTEDPNLYKDINKTSIGNLAYIAIHGSNEPARKKSLRILENIKSLWA